MQKMAYMLVSTLLLCFMVFTDISCANDDPGQLSEPRLAPLGEAEWNDDQSRLLTPLKKHFPDEKVINIITTVARNPKLLEAWLSFSSHVLQTSSLPPRDRELLILRIGWLCRSEYEFGQHTLVGKQVGLSDKEILRITRGADADGWSEFDAALIRSVDELHKDAFMTDEIWHALSAGYNEKQMLDLIFTVGQYNLVCMTLKSLGVQLDQGVPGFPEGAGL